MSSEFVLLHTHSRERAVEDEIGRGYTRGGVTSNPYVFAIQVATKVAQPCYIHLQLASSRRRALVADVFRGVQIGAGKVADDIRTDASIDAAEIKMFSRERFGACSEQYRLIVQSSPE